MKKLLIGIGAAVVVLVIAAVIIGPRFYDWNSFKPEIAARVQAATGRALAIDGDISLSILPSPTLEVEQVRFANAADGSAPDMATLDALKVRVAFMPLLRGEIQVDSVVLVRPTILLETLPDGSVNWQLGAGEDAAAGAAAGDGSGGGTPAVSLESVEIEDGTLVYRDAASGTEERAEALNATISADSLQGPFEASGSARAHGVPLEFDAASGRLASGEKVPLSLRLAVSETGAQASLGGSLTTGERTGFTGKLSAQGDSFARLLAVLSPGITIPAALADSFAVDADVAYAEPTADFTGLTLRVGETTATGGLAVDTGAPLYAKAALKINRLDLDKLLPGPVAAGVEGAAEVPADSPPAAAPAGTEAAGGFSLPREIGGELELIVEAIGYGGGVVRDARLNAVLADGEIAITRAAALLPGGSDLVVAGTIDAEGGQPRFAGAVEASSDNLRSLLDWLKAPVPAGADSDRLRKLSMTTRITATPTAVQVADIDLRIDSSRVTGGVAIALPEAGRRRKPGFGIGLAIDEINLDGYLDGDATGADAETAAAGAGADTAAEPGGGSPFDALKPLAGFDANVELRIGSLTYHAQTVQGLHVDGTLQAGNLTLRDLSVREFAGGGGSISGTLTDFAGTPRFDTTFDLATSDAGRVLQFAGIDVPGRNSLGRLRLAGQLAGGTDDVTYDASFSLGGIGAEGEARGSAEGFSSGIPRIDTELSVTAQDAGPLLELAGLEGAAEAKLGALALTGTATSGTDDLTYDLNITLSGIGGSGALAGQITAISSATPRVDTRLDLSAEKPAALLRLAGMDGAAAGKLGAIGIAGTMAGGADAMRLDLDLAGLGGTAKVSGTVSATPAAPETPGATPATTFDLALDARHPELRQLLTAVAEDYRPSGDTLGPLHVTTTARGSTEAADLTDLAIEAGGRRVTGTASYEAGGTRPMVVAALAGNSLDLTGLMPAESKPGSGSGGSDGTGANDGTGGSDGTGGGRWSSEPLDLSALDAADADISLTADAVILDDTRIDDMNATLTLRDGVLTLTQLTGDTYGGKIDLNGQLAGRGVASASGTLTATNIDSAALLEAGLLGADITGPVSLTADFSTIGVSMAEMVDGLDGSGNLGGTITVLTRVEQQVGSALLDLLGTRVKEVKGLTDTVNTVFSAFAGAPNRLAGDFVITNGVLDTQNTTLENENARLLAQGQADLAAWTMDMLASVFRLPAAEPYLKLGLDGALDAPNAKLSGKAISGGAGAAGAAGGALEQLVPGLSGGGVDEETTAPSGGGLGGVLQQVIPGLGGQQGEAPGAQPGDAPGAAGTAAPPEPAPKAVEPEPAAPEPSAEPAPTLVPPAEEVPADEMPTGDEGAAPEPGAAEPGAVGTAEPGADGTGSGAETLPGLGEILPGLLQPQE